MSRAVHSTHRDRQIVGYDATSLPDIRLLRNHRSRPIGMSRAVHSTI